MLNNIPEPKLLSKEDFTFGKNLVNNLIVKKIGMEEFKKEVAYFVLNCGFDELTPHPEPSRPDELIKYDGLTFGEKKKVGESFWKQSIIYNHLAQKTRVKHQNKTDKEWLKEIMGRFEKYGDKVCAEKIRVRLNRFEYGK